MLAPVMPRTETMYTSAGPVPATNVPRMLQLLTISRNKLLNGALMLSTIIACASACEETPVLRVASMLQPVTEISSTRMTLWINSMRTPVRSGVVVAKVTTPDMLTSLMRTTLSGGSSVTLKRKTAKKRA